MGHQEVLPPERRMTTMPSVHVPTVYTGGPVAALTTKWGAGFATKALTALSEKNQALAALNGAHAQVIASQGKVYEAIAYLNELPERVNHDLHMRRMRRVEEFQELRHQHQLNGKRREREDVHADTLMTEVKTINTVAKVALTDAEQRLEAQRMYGAGTYRLSHYKTQAEMLDVQLDNDERRRELRRGMGEEAPGEDVPDDEILARLRAVKNQLNGVGQDTAQVDEAIRALQAKK